MTELQQALNTPMHLRTLEQKFIIEEYARKWVKFMESEE